MWGFIKKAAKKVFKKVAEVINNTQIKFEIISFGKTVAEGLVDFKI